MLISRLAIIAAISCTLTACVGNLDSGAGPQEDNGTVVGGVAGALIGSQFGGGTGGHIAGALVGAGLGALIGNRMGAAMDDRDRERAYAAQMAALNEGAPGAPVSWRNADSGRYGSVVPGPAYVDGGRSCRSYTHTIYIDGQPQTARGTACRNPDGSWTPLS